MSNAALLVRSEQRGAKQLLKCFFFQESNVFLKVSLCEIFNIKAAVSFLRAKFLSVVQVTVSSLHHTCTTPLHKTAVFTRIVRWHHQERRIVSFPCSSFVSAGRCLCLDLQVVESNQEATSTQEVYESTIKLPFYAALCFHSSTFQREILYFLLHFIYVTALVPCHP